MDGRGAQYIKAQLGHLGGCGLQQPLGQVLHMAAHRISHQHQALLKQGLCQGLRGLLCSGQCPLLIRARAGIAVQQLQGLGG